MFTATSKSEAQPGFVTAVCISRPGDLSVGASFLRPLKKQTCCLRQFPSHILVLSGQTAKVLRFDLLHFSQPKINTLRKLLFSKAVTGSLL